MRRFFVPQSLLCQVAVGDEIILPKEVRHHVKTVLRLAKGSELLLGDGQGSCCRCSLARLDGDVVAVVNECSFNEQTALPVELFQGLPGGDKFELVLQKNTELGVSRFYPLVTERSQFKVPGHKLDRKMERWQRIVNEAARQSQRAWLPCVERPAAVAHGLAQSNAELKLLLWEQGTRPLKTVLPSNTPAGVAVFIGPEGGLTSAEVDVAQKSGFIPVSMGPRILRTETAGLTIAAILQFQYGDFDLLPEHHLTPPI